jgi:hypothetical protein
VQGLSQKNMVENLQRSIVRDRILGRVRNKMIHISLKIKMIQTFFRICLLKKYQCMLELQWRLDVYLVRVGSGDRSGTQTRTCR